MSKAEHNFYPKENSIPRYFNDRRSFRSNTPNKREDQIIERDIALSLISEIITDGRRAIPTIYWGIIMPEDLELVNFSKYRTHCPNCINGVYTNLWTFSEEYFSFTKKWQNIFILSPNITYPQPFRNMLDCQTISCGRF